MLACPTPCFQSLRRLLFRDAATTVVLSTSVLLLTITLFLALSISLRSTYLWLTAALVSLVFLATFTCACTVPLPGSDMFCHDTGTHVHLPSVTAFPSHPVQTGANLPYWITVDPPPSYDLAVGALPPSYSKATSGMLKLELPTDPLRTSTTVDVCPPS